MKPVRRALLIAGFWAVLPWTAAVDHFAASPLQPGGSPMPAPARPGEVRARAPADVPEPPARPWPVDVPVHLSSSFGEFRAGHLHAGLDIRSFGREGIPCRAVDGGYVSRLRASPFGYGKAVYLKLESGETVVYAHLAEFAEEIGERVEAAQRRTLRYETDIYLEPHELSLKKGQIVGYMGRTGAAAPHLHFEVRDAADHPVNPLAVGWLLSDREPPEIRRLKCLPLSPESTVDGRCAPAVVQMRPTGPRAFAAAETLRVSGSVGFGADIVDRAGTDSGKLAPFRVELEQDGERLAAMEMQSFSYDQTGEVELVYDMDEARGGGGHYILLFRRRGETLSQREFVDGGVIRAEPRDGEDERVRTIVVRATDFAGNTSEARAVVVVGTGEADGAGAAEKAAGARAAAGTSKRAAARGGGSGVYFFEDFMSAAGEGGAPPDSNASDASATPDGAGGDSGEFVLTFDAVGETPAAIRVKIDGGVRDVHLIAVRPDAPFEHDFPGLGVSLAAGPGSVFANSLLFVSGCETCAGENPTGSGTRVLTAPVRLGPRSAVLRKAVEIRFSAAGPPEGRAAVFQWDEEKSRWSFRRSTSTNGAISALVREPGIYAVLSDSLAPRIGEPTVARRKSFATGRTVVEAAIPLADGGCGVDAERSEVYVDGRKQIARWDGFLEKMFVIVEDENIIGAHDLSIVAVDRLGNSTRLVTQLRIPPPAIDDGIGGGR